MNPMLSQLNKNFIPTPKAMFDNLLNSNPQFRQFVAENKDKKPEQIAAEHGIDFNQIKQMLK